MWQAITPRLWLFQARFAGINVEMTPCMALEDSWI